MQIPVVAVFGHDDGFVGLVISIDNLREAPLGLIERQHLRINFGLIINLNPNETKLLTNSQVYILIKVLILITVLLEPNPILPLLLG